MLSRTSFVRILLPRDGSSSEPTPCCAAWSGSPNPVASFLSFRSFRIGRLSSPRTASSTAFRARRFGSSRSGTVLRSRRSRGLAANFTRALGKELDPAQRDGETGPGEVLDVGEGEEVLAELGLPELSGGPVEGVFLPGGCRGRAEDAP